MKIYLFACLLIFSFAFFSCEVCEQCTTVITTSAPGIPNQISEATFEACGSDRRDAEGTVTSTASSGGITATSVAVTTCN